MHRDMAMTSIGEGVYIDILEIGKNTGIMAHEIL